MIIICIQVFEAGNRFTLPNSNLATKSTDVYVLPYDSTGESERDTHTDRHTNIHP